MVTSCPHKLDVASREQHRKHIRALADIAYGEPAGRHGIDLSRAARLWHDRART